MFPLYFIYELGTILYAEFLHWLKQQPIQLKIINLWACSILKSNLIVCNKTRSIAISSSFASSMVPNCWNWAGCRICLAPFIKSLWFIQKCVWLINSMSRTVWHTIWLDLQQITVWDILFVTNSSKQRFKRKSFVWNSAEFSFLVTPSYFMY